MEAPSNADKVFFDLYMIEAVNEDENQWKNYHKVPKKFRSLKLCGIDPKDFKFRLRTYRESVCKSGPSKEVFVKKAKKEGKNLNTVLL
ncbi:hypothetical protein TNCT_315881 [Trichonephila clavata]|uniref:Uncharacterized protein n=1 Tax=Trichonephila clavata TaxID=2740835 RepID=A0A8X6HCJ2_TRICU|nr:hypothetical protein TNCT_315881 [Trichonephila clavata]